jgi:hypothetical protein
VDVTLQISIVPMTPDYRKMIYCKTAAIASMWITCAWLTSRQRDQNFMPYAVVGTLFMAAIV